MWWCQSRRKRIGRRSNHLRKPLPRLWPRTRRQNTPPFCLKSARRGKIYVDYLRNGRGATAISAYSTRARAGAPVSTPLAWEELSPAVKPSHFTLDNLPTRLRHLGSDPWADIGSVKQSPPTG